MNEKLLDLLVDHADMLNRHEDVAELDTAVWLNQYASAHTHNLLPLLQLAQSIKLALRPVRPPTLFKTELRQQLQQSSLTGVAKRSIGRFLWLGAAIIGSTVSIIVILRRLKMLPSGSDVMGTAV